MVVFAVLLTLAMPPFSHAQSHEITTKSLGPLQLLIDLHDVDGDRRAPLERMTRKALGDVQQDFQTALSGQLAIDFVGSPESFKEVMLAHGARGWPEAWIAGLALLDQDRVIVQVNGPGALLTSETIRHELAHIMLHALAKGASLPRWYHEGVAMYLAGEATYERLREQSGAAGFGELDSLAQLDRGFNNEHRVSTQRAYAMAAGFVKFAVHQVGDQRALLELHQRMASGLDFSAAFASSFGRSPEDLYAVYAAKVGQSASSWTLLLSDSLLWSLVSLLAVAAMLTSWRNRPRFEADDEPLDLEAIALAGEIALRPWKHRDFTAQPLQILAEPEANDGLELADIAEFIIDPLAPCAPNDAAVDRGWAAEDTAQESPTIH